MKTILLTHGKTATVSDEDYERVAALKWHAIKGPGLTWYAVRRTSRRCPGPRGVIWMHRFILNAPKGIDVDHKDRNGLNNTRENLRLCTKRENMRNTVRTQASKTSRYHGVSYYKSTGKWKAQIKTTEKKVSLGYFLNEIDAAHAFDRAAAHHFGEFAVINFPQELCGAST